MSYDYILVKGVPGTGIEALMEQAVSQPIGAVEDVKALISQTFPSVQWENEIMSDPGLNFEGFFGHDGPPEFQLTAESDGLVYMITMSRAEREEVELLANKLGLIAIDEQSMDIFDG